MDNIELTIKKLLVERNLSLEKLANSIGLTRQGLGKMLQNNSIRVEILEKIAKYLDVPFTYFFDGSRAYTDDKHLCEIDLVKFEILCKEIMQNALNGKGLIYLSYDVYNDTYHTMYKELKKKVTKTELGNIYINKLIRDNNLEQENEKKRNKDNALG